MGTPSPFFFGGGGGTLKMGSSNTCRQDHGKKGRDIASGNVENNQNILLWNNYFSEKIHLIVLFQYLFGLY